MLLSGCNFTSDALDKEREWKSQEIHDYRFVYTVSCFCGFTGPNPAVITVIDDEVVKVEYLAPSQNGGTVSTNGYPTIDGIFALLAAARARNPDKIDVDYDSQYGFPRSIEIDYVKNAADDEIEYKVENFTILTSGG
jgi:hypothetical protein